MAPVRLRGSSTRGDPEGRIFCSWYKCFVGQSIVCLKDQRKVPTATRRGRQRRQRGLCGLPTTAHSLLKIIAHINRLPPENNYPQQHIILETNSKILLCLHCTGPTCEVDNKSAIYKVNLRGPHILNGPIWPGTCWKHMALGNPIHLNSKISLI